jgi:uncharacterized protein with GYD domain
MPTYVVLAQFTDQGLRNIRDFPQRARENLQRAQGGGITIKAAYVTEGEYDQVIIFEAPDEQLGVASIVALIGQGNVRTKTLRAYSVEEFAQAIARIPG